MIALLLSAAWAGPLTLSYEEALRLAAARNVSVLTAGQDVLVAEASLLAARAPFEPVLATSGGYGFNRDKGYSNQFGSEFESEASGWNWSAGLSQVMATGTSAALDVSLDEGKGSYDLIAFDQTFLQDPTYNSRLALTLSQSLLQGNRLATNLQGVHAAARLATQAEAQAAAARQRALADAASAYWALHYAREGVAIAQATVDVQHEQQRVTQALVDGGKLAAVERTRIDAATAQAERALLDARNAAAQAEDTLLLVVGEVPGTAVVLSSPPPAPPPISLDEGQVVAAVLAGNPDLAVLRTSQEGAVAGVADARNALLPELGVSATAGVTGFGDSLGTALSSLGDGYRELNVGASLTVPLLNRADRAGLDSAKADAEKARLALEAQEQVLAQQARAQIRTLEAARQTVDLAQLNVRLAEETLGVERARFAEGKTLQTTVIQAVKDLDQARVAAEKALIDYQLAVVELERLKGGL